MYDDIYLCVFILPTGVLWVWIFTGKCSVLFDLYTASWIFYKKTSVLYFKRTADCGRG